MRLGPLNVYITSLLPCDPGRRPQLDRFSARLDFALLTDGVLRIDGVRDIRQKGGLARRTRPDDGDKVRVQDKLLRKSALLENVTLVK